MKLLLTLSVPIWFFQFFTCNINQSLVGNTVLMCVSVICPYGECCRWGFSPLDSLQIHSCLVSQGCGVTALVRSPYTAQSLRSSSSFLSSMKDVTTCTTTDTLDQNHDGCTLWPLLCLQVSNNSVYLQGNHQTTPTLRDVQGLSYLNPPRTSDPLF